MPALFSAATKPGIWVLSSGVMISPFAEIRSLISYRNSRGTRGANRRKNRLKDSGRFPRPISKMSRNPSVVTRAVLAPRRSKILLITTVQPCFRMPAFSTLKPAPLSLVKQSTAPSSGAGVLDVFSKKKRLETGSNAARSVNVPPMSIPTTEPMSGLSCGCANNDIV